MKLYHEIPQAVAQGPTQAEEGPGISLHLRDVGQKCCGGRC